MLLITTAALLTLTAQPAQPRPHIPAHELNDIATILAHDEGWPMGDPDYTLDVMQSEADDGFDSIGIYKKRHLVRAYAVDRASGEIVDFLRGCQVFRFENIKNFQQRIRRQSNASIPTDQQLAAKAGCAKLTVVNTRWVDANSKGQ